MRHVIRNPFFGVFHQVSHKRTATEDGQRPEIFYLRIRENLQCSENKGADQLRGYRAVLICAFIFTYMQKAGILMTSLIWFC